MAELAKYDKHVACSVCLREAVRIDGQVRHFHCGRLVQRVGNQGPFASACLAMMTCPACSWCEDCDGKRSEDCTEDLTHDDDCCDLQQVVDTESDEVGPEAYSMSGVRVMQQWAYVQTNNQYSIRYSGYEVARVIPLADPTPVGFSEYTNDGVNKLVVVDTCSVTMKTAAYNFCDDKSSDAVGFSVEADSERVDVRYHLIRKPDGSMFVHVGQNSTSVVRCINGVRTSIKTKYHNQYEQRVYNHLSQLAPFLIEHKLVGDQLFRRNISELSLFDCLHLVREKKYRQLSGVISALAGVEKPAHCEVVKWNCCAGCQQTRILLGAFLLKVYINCIKFSSIALQYYDFVLTPDNVDLLGMLDFEDYVTLTERRIVDEQLLFNCIKPVLDVVECMYIHAGFHIVGMPMFYDCVSIDDIYLSTYNINVVVILSVVTHPSLYKPVVNISSCSATTPFTKRHNYVLVTISHVRCKWTVSTPLYCSSEINGKQALVDELKICQKCKGVFSRKYISRHKRRCASVESSKLSMFMKV